MAGKVKRYTGLFLFSLVVAGIISYFIIDYQDRMLVESMGKSTYLENLQQSAEDGDANAMFRMGNNHKYGYNGLTPDNVAAFKWYQKAADHGDPDGMNALGLLYKEGEGVEKDYEKARSLFEAAMKLSNIEAHINMGVMYLFGDGVPKDEKRAFSLFTYAAERGNAAAISNIGKMYNDGIGVEQNYAKANELFADAIKRDGVASAQHLLALNLTSGHGIEKDLGKACELFSAAAGQNHASAQYWLAGCYFKGSGGFNKDSLEAAYWYGLARDNGNPDARQFLDEMNKACTGGIMLRSASYCLVAASAGYGIHRQSLVSCITMESYWSRTTTRQMSGWKRPPSKEE